MNWEHVRNWGMILALLALGGALLWGLGFAVYLNRIGSRGWASTRRLLTSSMVAFAIALPAVIVFAEGPAFWSLVRGWLGSAEGQYRTGILYSSSDTFLQPTPSKATVAFRRAAEQGHSQAQFALAQACHVGLGTAKNRAEALRWAQAAAQAGHPLAMVLAGDILRETSAVEGEPYFRRAAPLLRAQGEQGDGQACFTLGRLYREGLGVAQDPEEALFWMQVAQRLGISPLQGFAIQIHEKSLPSDLQSRARTRAEAWIQTRAKT